MHALKACVRHGRIIVDEPTDLPEGTELELVPADLGDMTEEDRALLEQELERAANDVAAGQFVAGETVKEWLRKRA